VTKEQTSGLWTFKKDNSDEDGDVVDSSSVDDESFKLGTCFRLMEKFLTVMDPGLLN
jgi:hypothetical protein